MTRAREEQLLVLVLVVASLDAIRRGKRSAVVKNARVAGMLRSLLGYLFGTLDT